ncbi:glycosyltransferase [Candidatus Pelagibacter sp.]|nr:glycosyltransferase [Candidatus Pelagibacter sp.]
MQKIYYITYSSIPSLLPSSLQIIKTCESLAKSKYDVTLIKPGTGNKNYSIKKYYNIKEKVSIKEFSSIKKFPQGIKFYLYSVYCLLYILKQKEPIIITRNYFISYLCILFKKKVIIEIHNDTLIEGRVTKFILKYFNFFNNKNLINLVAISHAVKNLFIKKYSIYPKKITVLHSGSSIKINFKPKLVHNKRLKIAYFGSISSSKGIDTLIKLSKIDQKNDYYVYGGDKEQIRKIKKRNSNNNLFLNSSIPYAKIPEAMLSMDILTMPYKKTIRSAGEVDDISKYTSPLKLFDYLAVGKIIITSDLNVLREVIGDRNAYFIKNYQNVYEWKKNIELVKNNRTKNLVISKNNLNLSKNYDHSKRVKKYL